MNTAFNITLFLAYALCSGSGLIILKAALNNRGSRLMSITQTVLQPQFLLGFLLYACGFVLWMFILSKFKLNIAFPVATSLFFVVSGLGSYYVLRESFSITQIVGMVLCLAGILLINLKA